MAEVLLFHHAQGLTAGVLAFADALRAAGHVVHTPDLYEGTTFATLAEGIANAERIGFGKFMERGREAAESLPREIVYAGFSLGVLPAQMLAQTRAGAKGALLIHSAIPLREFGDSWPKGVPLQIHMMEEDELAVREGDLETARSIAKTVKEAELFLYPGNRHLFADDSLPSYDERAAKMLRQRVLEFLNQVAGAPARGGNVPDTAYPYATHLNVYYEALKTVDVPALVAANQERWYNQTLCKVNDSVVRLGVIQGEYHWHKHDKDDEFFYVVEGKLLIDLEGRSVELGERQGFVVPKGVVHRTRAPERTIILMVENAGIVPTGDPDPA